MNPIIRNSFAVATLAGLALSLGCARSAEFWQSEKTLRDVVKESTARELRAAERGKAPRQLSREDRTGELGIKPQFQADLDKLGGPKAYDPTKAPLGLDLSGEPVSTVLISLEKVIRTAAENNLAVQFARIGPAISQAQITAAEAAFDWTLFSNAQQSWQDSPQPSSSINGSAFGNSINQQNVMTSAIGLRRPLTTGGRFTMQQDFSYSDNKTPGLSVRPDPASLLAFTLQFDQPLLRGFGSEVSTAEIKLARNAERTSISQLKRDLMRQVNDAEKTYWQLVQTQRDLMIFTKLLDQGLQVRDQLKARAALDATPAVIAEAIARVEARRADVLRAQTALHQLSDRLKTLMNDRELVVGSETLLVPADDAADQPITYSLFDAVMAGITERPEISQAILSIDDTSIRQQVALNARMPQLDVRLQTKFSSLQSSLGNTYSDIGNADFIDYLVGIVFERPIGNRKPEADMRRAKLQRMQAVIAYRNTVQQITREVKDALDRTSLNYRLIAQTRTGRLASAEALRTFLVEKELTKGYTVDRLNIEFSRQESLAQAERAENAALSEYNSSICDLYLSMGRTLERANISFNVEDADLRMLEK